MPQFPLLCIEGSAFSHGCPWESHSGLRAHCSRACISLLCQTWSPELGSIRATSGPQSRSGVRARRCLVTCFTAVFQGATQTPLWARQKEHRPDPDWAGQSKEWGPPGPGSPARACRPHPHAEATWHLEAVWRRSGSGKFQSAGGLQGALDGRQCSTAATWLVGPRVRGHPEAFPE